MLTREFKPDGLLVHYTTHPALDEDGSVVKNATEIIQLKGNDPASSFQQHRFDWTNDELRFYQNSELVHTNAWKVPEVAGHVYINLWADGGMWSGIPSTTDVLLSVKTVAIYHNTTLSDMGIDRAFNARCERAGGPSNITVCLDAHIENGKMNLSSVGSAVTPVSVWVLMLLCVLCGMVFSLG